MRTVTRAHVALDMGETDATRALARLVWATYRTGIAPAVGGRTTDVGWGCSIRCGQMLVCNAISVLIRGGGATDSDCAADAADVDPDDASRPIGDVRAHCAALIADVPPGEETPRGMLGIHALVAAGLQAGTWHGPCAVASAIADVVNARRPRGLSCAVVRDMAVPVEAIRALVCAGPVLVWLVLRLGATQIPPEMRGVPATLLRAPHGAGVLGGTLSRALYLYGVASDGGSDSDGDGGMLLHLDPHVVHAADAGPSSYVCASVSVLPASALDPSMAAGFVLRDARALEEWLSWLPAVPFVTVVHDAEAHDASPSYAIGDADSDGFAAIDAL